MDTSVRVNYTVVLEDSWKRDLDADFTNLSKLLECVRICRFCNHLVSGKAYSPTKGGLICLYRLPLLVSQTVPFLHERKLYPGTALRHNNNGTTLVSFTESESVRRRAFER